MTEGGLRAVIWDMDGVIADTASYHEQAWRMTFKKRGVAFSSEDFRRTFGQRNDTIIPDIMGKHLSEDEIEAIGDEKEADYRRRIGQSIKPLPGVVELMEGLSSAGFRQALVSSAPMESIRLILGSLGIEKYFQSILSGEDVAEGKPNPQGYLVAANRLGVVPENCIVIEDAVAGVAGAKRGGMRCLAVTNTHPRSGLQEADLIVDSLEEVTVAGLIRLLDNPEGQNQHQEESGGSQWRGL